MRRDDARRGSWRPAAAIAAGIALLLPVLLAGCAGEPKDAVVSIKGWAMNLAQVQQAYNRIHEKEGPDAWSAASADDRVAFAGTLADKEILLRLAKKDNPRLDGKQARVYRVTYERNIQRDFLRWRRERFHIPPDIKAKQVPMVSREAKARLIMLSSKDLFPQVTGDVQNGLGFDALVKKYVTDPGKAPEGPDVTPGGPSVGRSKPADITIRIDNPKIPPSVIAHTLLREGAPGVLPPFETNDGPVLIEVLEYRPIPEAADTSFTNNVMRALDSIGYMAVYRAWSDSLHKAAGVTFHPEAYPVIKEKFAAYWDSLQVGRQQGQKVDFQTLRAPVWRFTAEERKQPVFDMWGKTNTIEDYVRTLDHIDLDNWPTVGPIEKISYQIENRIHRLLYQTEGEKVGYQKNPDFTAKMQRAEEECFLEQYHDAVGSKLAPVTDAELKAEYDKAPESYRMPDLVSFSVITWPLTKEARAKSMLERIRRAGVSSWAEAALAETKADTTVVYMPDSNLLDTARPSPNPAWSSYLASARQMQPDQLSDLIHTGVGVSIVRVLQRQPARTMSLDEAKSYLQTRVYTAKQDSALEAILIAARKKAGVKVHPERLGAAQAKG